MHVPLFAHGDDAQSSILVWHVAPVKPGAHKHTIPFVTSSHVAPFRHSDVEAHKLVSELQVDPKRPGAQEHVNLFTLSVHVPPSAQGDDSHSSMLDAHVASM